MNGESDLLDELVGSAADGTEIDWDEVEKQLPADDELRRLLQNLRIVASVAGVHRSHVDDVGFARSEVSTRPVDFRLPHGKPEDARRPPPSEDHASDQGLGRWGHLLLRRKIGEGAFGEVFHAHDPWLDHPVALKLLKPNLASRDFSARMLYEARKLARVRHHNVVTVHGADSHNGRVGFWMDLIEGVTLAELVSQGRLSAGEAGYIGQEVCLALAAVHQAKMVHRDVKAQNVMRASDGGRIILMDFGAGEFIDDRLAGAGRQGTPLYLAPEILTGEAASARTDIYAVGVLLYYLVTGTFPVRGPSFAALAEAHARGERQRLRDGRPDLPDSFVTIVERALATDPMRRFPSAGDMHAALAGDPTGVMAVRLPKAPDPAGTGSLSQHRVLLVVGGFLTTVLALTLVGFITSRSYYAAIGLAPAFQEESSLTWPLWGLRSLLAPAILIPAFSAAGIVLFSSAYRLILMKFALTRRVTQPIAARVNAAVERIRESATSTTAPLLLIAQCALLALTWWWFNSLLGGLDSLIVQRPGGDLTPLSPANAAEQQRYRQMFSLELLAFTAAWASLLKTRFLRGERGGWVSIVGGIAVTIVTLYLLVMPYRIFSHNEHERVSYRSQTCYLLGQRNNEALLFCPLQEPPRNRVVRLDDPALERGGPEENMFSQLGIVR